MSGLEVLAAVGIVAMVIFQQLQGQHLRGKRTVVLPVVLTVIGFSDLHGHLRSADIVCLGAGIAGSAVIGLGFGAIMRLESRDGALWARMPMRGLWLWAAMVGWRIAVTVLAGATHAHVAASSSTLLLSLGVNRLAQAAVIVPRALAARVPFAAEKDGTTFMAGAFARGDDAGHRRPEEAPAPFGRRGAADGGPYRLRRPVDPRHR